MQSQRGCFPKKNGVLSNSAQRPFPATAQAMEKSPSHPLASSPLSLNHMKLPASSHSSDGAQQNEQQHHQLRTARARDVVARDRSPAKTAGSGSLRTDTDESTRGHRESSRDREQSAARMKGIMATSVVAVREKEVIREEKEEGEGEEEEELFYHEPDEIALLQSAPLEASTPLRNPAKSPIKGLGKHLRPLSASSKSLGEESKSLHSGLGSTSSTHGSSSSIGSSSARSQVPVADDAIDDHTALARLLEALNAGSLHDTVLHQFFHLARAAIALEAGQELPYHFIPKAAGPGAKSDSPSDSSVVQELLEAKSTLERKIAVLQDVAKQTESESVEQIEAAHTEAKKLKEENTRLRRQVREIQSDKSKLENTLETLEADLEDAQSRSSSGRGSFRARRGSSSSMVIPATNSGISQEEFEELKGSLGRARRENAHLQAELKDAHLKLLERENTAATLQHEVSLAQMALDEMKARCEQLRRENHELCSNVQERSSEDATAGGETIGDITTVDAHLEARLEAEKRAARLQSMHESFKKKVEEDVSVLLEDRDHLKKQVEVLSLSLKSRQSNVTSPDTSLDVSGREMQTDKWLALLEQKGVQADGMTYSTAILGCVKKGLVDEADQWLEKMTAAGFKATQHIFNSVINMHASLGDIARSEKFFGMMRVAGYRPNSLAYTRMVKACVVGRDAPKAEIWLEKAREDGIGTEVVITGARSEVSPGLFDEVMAAWDSQDEFSPRSSPPSTPPY